MVNCKIQEGKFEKGLEITASSRTTIESSPKRFKLDDLQPSISTGNKHSLGELSQLENQLVTVVCKVVKLSDIMDVKSNNGNTLKKQILHC